MLAAIKLVREKSEPFPTPLQIASQKQRSDGKGRPRAEEKKGKESYLNLKEFYFSFLLGLSSDISSLLQVQLPFFMQKRDAFLNYLEIMSERENFKNMFLERATGSPQSLVAIIIVVVIVIVIVIIIIISLAYSKAQATSSKRATTNSKWLPKASFRSSLSSFWLLLLVARLLVRLAGWRLEKLL